MPSATTNDGRVLDSRAANQDVATHNRRMNNSRWSPPILPRIQALREEYVHVFSVSPWSFVRPMGAWGTFTIPACPDGEEFVEYFMHNEKGQLNPVPGIMIQFYPQDETRMGMHEEDGREWAEKLLNNDVGIPQSHSLNRFGVFVAKGEKPTTKELRTARAELNDKLLELINQARTWHNDPVQKEGIRKEVHFKAAEILNLTDEPWMVASNPKGRQKCKMCGAFSDPDVIKCGACKEYIFDHAAYAAMVASQKAEQAAVAGAK